MARGGRGGRGTGDSDFDALHPRGADGKFVRKAKLAQAASARRGTRCCPSPA